MLALQRQESCGRCTLPLQRVLFQTKVQLINTLFVVLNILKGVLCLLGEAMTVTLSPLPVLREEWDNAPPPMRRCIDSLRCFQ